MTPDEDYNAWLDRRRAASSHPDLSIRILAALPDPPAATVREAPWSRLGIGLLAAAAGCVFAVRLGLFLGLLAFPTTSHPELASETLKEPPHDSRIDIRS